jgi:hypothetical protein
MTSTRRSTPSDAKSSSRTLTLAFFFSGARRGQRSFGQALGRLYGWNTPM